MQNAWIGKVVDGRYTVEGVLGEGGMGVVLRARHNFTGAEVALKMLHPELRMNAELAQRFLAEARAPTAIGHPGIVAIHDAGMAPSGEMYLAMEILRGETLGARIGRGAVSLADAQRIALETLAALGAAHAAGIVHRDLKPENVFLVAPANAVKVLDFGIAKMMRQTAANKTAAGAVIGTIAYMSPEQVRDTSSVDQRTDLWAMGVLFYEMISGKRPYEAESFGDYLSKLYQTTPKPIAEIVPSAPPAVESFIRRALAIDPAHRFQSASEMAAALRPLVAAGAVSKTVFDDGGYGRYAPSAPKPPVDAPSATVPAESAAQRTAYAAPLTGALSPQSQDAYPPPPVPLAPLPPATTPGTPLYAAPDPYAQPMGQMAPMHAPQPKSRSGLVIALAIGGIVMFIGLCGAGLMGVVYLLSMGEPTGTSGGPEPQGNEAVCEKTCDRLQACGGIDSAFCLKECKKSPPFQTCAAKAEDSCNGVSTCVLTGICGGVAPSGTRSCHETLNCQANCSAKKLNDESCLCGCLSAMTPSASHALMTNNVCVIARCGQQCGEHGNWSECFQCYDQSCQAESAACMAE